MFTDILQEHTTHLHLQSTVNMETAHSSIRSVNTYKTTWHHIPGVIYHLQVPVLLDCSDFKVYIGISPSIFVRYTCSYSVFSYTLAKSFSKSAIIHSFQLLESVHFIFIYCVWDVQFWFFSEYLIADMACFPITWNSPQEIHFSCLNSALLFFS
jgi:hypothetical protein